MESISIPANCEFQLVVTLMVDGRMCRNGNAGVLEPQPNFMERQGLTVAHSVAINGDGAISVQMLNPGSSSITLHKGEKLGRFVPLEGPYGVHVVEASQGRISTCEKDREVGPEIIESLIMGVKDRTGAVKNIRIYKYYLHIRLRHRQNSFCSAPH